MEANETKKPAQDAGRILAGLWARLPWRIRMRLANEHNLINDQERSTLASTELQILIFKRAKETGQLPQLAEKIMAYSVKKKKVHRRR